MNIVILFLKFCSILAIFTAAGIIGGDKRETLPGSAYWLLIPCVFVALGAFAIIYVLERRGKKA